jgi:hypothetical protein
MATLSNWTLAFPINRRGQQRRRRKVEKVIVSRRQFLLSPNFVRGEERPTPPIARQSHFESVGLALKIFTVFPLALAAAAGAADI